MPVVLQDPQIEVLNRQREIVARENPNPMDPREQREREEAARAYSAEKEKHFVDYLMDCVTTSRDAKADIRRTQDECWRVYQEDEPVSYANKEPWQSRVVIPKPFSAVQYGAAAVKKAFSPDFLSISDEKNKIAEAFWKKVMETQLNSAHANFVLKYSDATIMALAAGESMELVPRFIPGAGLRFDLVEPWKIHRDPDAPPRDTQGGMYWIHQEWVDFFVLKEGEKKGRYSNVDAAKNMGENTNDPFLTKEAIAERKKQIWTRSRFRQMIQVSELWGVILGPKGEMLLPNATYTVAGGRVISPPKSGRYSLLRWPGVSFSPLPDILSFGGRGLLKGIITIWEAMCKLICLHIDALNWVVNPPLEIVAENLVDPRDVEDWPGKKYLVHDTPTGHQTIREVRRRDVTNTMLANSQYLDQNFQRGTFVTDAVQGLPGYRKDMTFRESAQNLDQAMGVYSLMGGNLEQGAVDAVTAGYDVVRAYAGYDDYRSIFSDQELQEIGIRPDGEKGIQGLPVLSGRFHISGISALMKNAETLQNIKGTVIPMAESNRFAPYVRPYQVIKALEARINLSDENVFVNEETGQKLEELQFATLLGSGPPPEGGEDGSGGEEPRTPNPEQQ